MRLVIGKSDDYFCDLSKSRLDLDLVYPDLQDKIIVSRSNLDLDSRSRSTLSIVIYGV